MDAMVHLELLLRPGVQPPTGVLVAAGREQMPFSGYLELLSAIERVTVDTAVGSAPARPAEQRGAS